jgi:hypothetical protein
MFFALYIELMQNKSAGEPLRFSGCPWWFNVEAASGRFACVLSSAGLFCGPALFLIVFTPLLAPVLPNKRHHDTSAPPSLAAATGSP